VPAFSDWLVTGPYRVSTMTAPTRLYPRLMTGLSMTWTSTPDGLRRRWQQDDGWSHRAASLSPIYRIRPTLRVVRTGHPDLVG
jgi:hypothetical protein